MVVALAARCQEGLSGQACLRQHSALTSPLPKVQSGKICRLRTVTQQQAGKAQRHLAQARAGGIRRVCSPNGEINAFSVKNGKASWPAGAETESMRSRPLGAGWGWREAQRRVLLVVLADFAGPVVQDFQSQRACLDLPPHLENSSTRGISERVNKDACLTFHFASAGDESLRAFSVSRMLRKCDKRGQFIFAHCNNQSSHASAFVEHFLGRRMKSKRSLLPAGCACMAG